MSAPDDNGLDTRSLTVFFILVSVLSLVLDLTIVATVAITIAVVYYIARWSDILSEKLKPVAFTCFLAVVFAALGLQGFFRGDVGFGFFSLLWAAITAVAAWAESTS